MVKQEHVVLMECTGYCNCWYCTGHHKGDTDYGRTFFGATAGLGTVAADTNLFKPGTRLYIPGYGPSVVSDKGSGITGNKLDLWFPDHATARAYGRKQLPVQVID
ncbi:MAG: 3D domain-containing protein [Thermacetogeniaceae bacterium]